MGKWLIVLILMLSTGVGLAGNAGEAKTQVMVLTESNSGTNVIARVGAVIEIRLGNDSEGAGWEPGGITGQSVEPCRENHRAFMPGPNAAPDTTVGTFIFRYACVRKGKSAIRLVHVSPSGPKVMRRSATALLGEFVVGVEVREE